MAIISSISYTFLVHCNSWKQQLSIIISSHNKNRHTIELSDVSHYNVWCQMCPITVWYQMCPITMCDVICVPLHCVMSDVSHYNVWCKICPNVGCMVVSQYVICPNVGCMVVSQYVICPNVGCRVVSQYVICPNVGCRVVSQCVICPNVGCRVVSQLSRLTVNEMFLGWQWMWFF